MLTFEQIKELIDLVAAHRLSGFELERSGFRCRIEGYKPGKTVAVASPASPETPAPPPPPTKADASSPGAPESQGTETAADLHVVSSPIVGTFYRAPNPEAPSFADVGSRVAKGQVLCIIEAMKLMNEIEADVAGVVVEVYPKNGQPVEFGERLFALKAD